MLMECSKILQDTDEFNNLITFPGTRHSLCYRGFRPLHVVNDGLVGLGATIG